MVVNEAGLHTTETELTVDITLCTGACTFNDAAPDFDGSCVLLAVTVTFPEDAGAVNSPFVLMAPALADQFTAEL